MGTSLAHAQASRTWVSGVGDDANPCSRTAPCKTFAGAISKTAAKGEISVLDPGGFGAVTINKSITINGDGTLAGILASSGNGVVINAGATDVVVLRNLSIVGFATGTNGVRMIAGGALVLDHVDISGFTGSAVDLEPSNSPSLVTIKDCVLKASLNGVLTNPASRVDVEIDRTTIRGNTTGVNGAGGFINVKDSTIAQNPGTGVLVQEGAVNLEGVMLTGNGVAAQASAGATLRIWDSALYDNQLGFGCGGGTIASNANNRKANNSGSPNPACAPNALITLQ
jgi:hypothetical protein